MRKSSLSEDTLLRMLVTAIASTIARIAMLRTAGNYQQALREIDQNLEELLGLKADLVRQLDDTNIVEMLTSQRSAKSSYGSSIDLAKSEVEQLYPTISMPVSIALFDLGDPDLPDEKGGD